MNTWDRSIGRVTIWALLAIAMWHAALVITFVVVMVLAWTWDANLAWQATDHAIWAGALAIVANLIHENRQLKRAWIKGYRAGESAGRAL